MASAQKTWELENAIKLVDPHRDALYTYDAPAIKAENDAHPWRSDPHHFKTVLISAVALLKMVMHARSGGSLEIMGLMQGYVQGSSIIVTDAFRLPVEGTETRVNAQAQADEYMVEFGQRARDAGQLENPVGWYHSHPGYGCWLSGIDVDTQMLQQTHNDPFLAVVIDPDRTISAGKVEIGAFRTYPKEYKPAAEASSDGGDETIPLAKMEDFGAHAQRYYSLEVQHFKSSLDTKLIEALWNKYWVGTLSASPLLTNRDYGTKQMADLAQKIHQADRAAQARAKSGGGGGGMHSGGGFAAQQGPGGGNAFSPWNPSGPDAGSSAGAGAGGSGKPRDEALEKIVRAGNKIAAEEEGGLLAADVKARLFCGIGVVVGPARNGAGGIGASEEV